MSEWQPIETAPRDGEAIWLFYSGQPCLGYFDPPGPWDKDGKWFVKASFRRRGRETKLPDEIFGTYAFGVTPTHWQPLPEAPK